MVTGCVVGIGPLDASEVDALVAQIRGCQQMMLAASVAGDRSEVDRVAGLLRADVRRVMGVTEWMAGALVDGWVAELPTGHSPSQRDRSMR